MKFYDDLPEFKVLYHARAKRLKLAVSHQQIRLTVPSSASKIQIQHFVKSSESWLKESWAKHQHLQAVDRRLPVELQLFNLNQPIKIIYQLQSQAWVLSEQQLFIGNTQPENHLKKFVIAYAQQHLPLYLDQISKETALNFVGCSIRQPKTRWGSCTSKHNIMLNSALVLLPIEIVKYVCIHELAHTRQFNHSPAFWAQVQQHDADYQHHRKILKNTVMPYWWR